MGVADTLEPVLSGSIVPRHADVLNGWSLMERQGIVPLSFSPKHSQSWGKDCLTFFVQGNGLNPLRHQKNLAL